MRTIKTKLIFLALLLGIFGFSCSHDGTINTSNISDTSEEVQTEPKTDVISCMPLKKLVWWMEGGGNLRFEVHEKDLDHFAFTHVTEGWNKTPYADFTLEKEENPELFSALKTLFAGNCSLSELKNLSYPPPLTGLWKRVTLVTADGSEKYFRDISENKVTAELNDGRKFTLTSIGDFVIKRLKLYERLS